MKAVVAGAGTLGKKISNYLINAGYEVIFIDYNLNTIKEVTNNEGLVGIFGQCTSLEVMQNADVGNAEIFIAVTSSDEINILGCEVANYFGTPRKIARINNPNYLTSEWLNNMYTSQNISVTSVLAINIILADNIIKTLSLNNNHCVIDKYYEFFSGKVKLVSLFCLPNLNIIGESLSILYNSYFTFNFKVLAINRDNSFIDIANEEEVIIQQSDRIYILIESSQLARFLELIDNKDKVEKYYDYNYITIIGVHDAIHYLARKLMNIPKVRLNIITNSNQSAQDIAKDLQQTSKDRLNVILTDNFEKSIKSLYPRYNEKFIIMNQCDRENILLSLYCKYSNLENISCVLQNSEYESLLNYIGINNIYVTDQYVLIPVINELKGPYENKVALIKNDIKLVELHIAAKSVFIGKKLSEINVSHHGITAIAALTVIGKHLHEEVHIKDNNLLIQEGDRVIFSIQYKYIKQAEELFNQFLL